MLSKTIFIYHNDLDSILTSVSMSLYNDFAIYFPKATNAKFQINV
jgi:hypothetical protein